MRDGVGYGFRKMWRVGDIWMGAGDMTFFEQGQGEDQLQKRRCTILFTNYDTSKVTSSQYKIMISM